MENYRNSLISQKEYGAAILLRSESHPDWRGGLMENRRKLKRKPMVGSLNIYTTNDRRSIGKGYVTNLNENGIGIVTEEPLKLGDEVLLDFKLPNGWEFDFFGKVVYEEKGVSTMSYGVEFLPGQSTFIFKIV
jgi:Tfp pilus assembly protein PilZ